MNQEPIITLQLEVEEVNKVLTGLNYYKNDIDRIAQKIVQTSQIQINEHNKKLQEAEKKVIEEANKNNKKASKEEGENK
ncbi:MAG: hypothetical protein IJS58_03120 [Bacilli bacterium]|nr:hypothetical protein [bacterium]MBQ3474635.1 hypothetical protein [Bacilli bacterium]MBQ7276220.1 hypothetical protein [Bacilli bacterium]